MLPLVLLSSAVAAIALPNPVVTDNQPLDVNNPSAADPITPPSSISFPPAVDNPFPDGFPDLPDGCDGRSPSEDCANAMKKANNYIWFDKNSGCSDVDKRQIETAVWDATTLANYASTFPAGARGIASGLYWMGPNFEYYENRIAGNFGRAAAWKLADNNQYITVSCNDPQKKCNQNRGIAKSVGGYAWDTYFTFLGWQYYINFCRPFFTVDSLATRLSAIESELANGEVDNARNMAYLGTGGQYFLHEMMHLRIADGGVEPHITDTIFDTPGRSAYGAKDVYNQAQFDIHNGGGAQWGSINADSYAMLANSIFWWDTTGYWPQVPPKVKGEIQWDNNSLPVSFYVDLYGAIDPLDADWDQLYAQQLLSLQNAYTAAEEEADLPPTTTVYVTPVPAGATPAP